MLYFVVVLNQGHDVVAVLKKDLCVVIDVDHFFVVKLHVLVHLSKRLIHLVPVLDRILNLQVVVPHENLPPQNVLFTNLSAN